MNKEKIRKLNLFLYGIAIPISIFALYPLFQVLTPEFGSMVWLGAVLCEQDFEPDKMKEPLCNNCNLCVDICPVNALENPEIKQQSCWDFAFGDDEEGQVWRIACHRCRDICPYNLGSQNSILRENDERKLPFTERQQT